MKQFQFLLLDAGPIIKLFELDIWDTFIEKCDVTIGRTVAEEAAFIIKEEYKESIELSPYEQRGQIKIIDIKPSLVKAFYDKFDLSYKAIIDDGEKEILAFLFNSSEEKLICSADHAVFRVLAVLGKEEWGISLEEVLNKIGLSQALEWKYTKKFRDKFTRIGQIESIQDKGLH